MSRITKRMCDGCEGDGCFASLCCRHGPIDYCGTCCGERACHCPTECSCHDDGEP